MGKNIFCGASSSSSITIIVAMTEPFDSVGCQVGLLSSMFRKVQQCEE